MSKELKEVAQEVTSLIAKGSYMNYLSYDGQIMAVDINQELEDLLDRLDELSKSKQEDGI